MTTGKEHSCIQIPRFIENEWKMKWNYELTLLKMEQLEKDIKSLGWNVTSDIKEVKDTLIKFIESADKKYVPRSEHENNKEKIKYLEDNQAKIAWAIIISVLGAVLSLILK